MVSKLSLWPRLSRVFAYVMVASLFLYLINNYLVYWQGLPGPYNYLAELGWLGIDAKEDSEDLGEGAARLGFGQVLIYSALLFSIAFYAWKTAVNDLSFDVMRFSNLSAYIIRSCFWAVLLIGIVDTTISLLRVENFLDVFVSSRLQIELGRPIFRGSYVHYPLLILAFVIAAFQRSISFSWLTLMVVLAEFSIVITRFVFSYEQAYMGDVVRFWYAALFLFASANTLVAEGHVRVDVIYATFKQRVKAWANLTGSLLFGMPICWVILMQGLGGKGNSINSPLLSFEISQSGYGLYVKYLMAGFLLVFAVSMLIQFVSYFLHQVSVLNHEAGTEEEDSYNQICSRGKPINKAEAV